MSRVTSLVVLTILFSVVAVAQFELGSVVGTVKDPTGLPMTNVSVELRSVSTNVVRQTATSATGDYDFVAVQPGQYALTAKAQGFKEITRSFELAVGQRTEIGVSMEVGASTQSITVGGNAVTVDTVSSDMSNVRTRQQVVDLPLNSRNFTQLVLLAPGVNSVGNSTNASNGGYTEGRGTNGAVVNGNRSNIGVYMFDGIQGVDADAN